MVESSSWKGGISSGRGHLLVCHSTKVEVVSWLLSQLATVEKHFTDVPPMTAMVHLVHLPFGGSAEERCATMSEYESQSVGLRAESWTSVRCRCVLQLAPESSTRPPARAAATRSFSTLLGVERVASLHHEDFPSPPENVLLLLITPGTKDLRLRQSRDAKNPRPRPRDIQF